MNMMNLSDDSTPKSSKRATRIAKLFVDLLKTTYQASLVGLIIIPFVSKRSLDPVIYLGCGVCLFCLFWAVILEVVRKEN